MTPFLRNAWYMAGWSEEITGAILSRRIAGQPLLLYRTVAGTVIALTDRCPHRFAPLSLGSREGDAIVCPYHGLTFDETGTCVRNPFGNSIPAGARVRAWPVKERDGIAWLWMGGKDAEDNATIPDFSVLTPSGDTRVLRGRTPMRANYEFGSDNLMDLSHIEFVHRGSFAGAGVIFAGDHVARQDGETLHSDWWMPNVRAPAHTFGIYPPDLITDHWLEMRWNAPASMYLQVGAAPAGDSRTTGVIVHQAHIVTPESDTTSHYFWASTYAAVPGQPDMSDMLKAMFSKAFDEEDKPMIEAAFANLEGRDFWAERPVSLGVDQGGARARRLLQEMARREAVL